jgi:hypothetical protein
MLRHAVDPALSVCVARLLGSLFGVRAVACLGMHGSCPSWGRQGAKGRPSPCAFLADAERFLICVYSEV